MSELGTDAEDRPIRARIAVTAPFLVLFGSVSVQRDTGKYT